MKLTLSHKQPETSDVQTFLLEPKTAFSWRPGQYLHYVFKHEHADNRGPERFFTIASAPFEKHVQITTRRAAEHGSSFKAALWDAPIGTQLEADGPKGEFTLAEGEHHHVLIAGGIGITPYRSMLVQLDHDGRDPPIDLLYANESAELVFGELLRELTRRRPHFKLHEFIGRRLAPADLSPYAKEADSIFYLSGPRAMVEAYQQMLTDLGVPEERIKTDYFPGY